MQGAPAPTGETYQLGLAAGMTPRYAVLRVKSDVVSSRIVEGMPRKEKYCVEPGTYMGLLFLFDATNGALLAILHDGLIQKLRVGADSALGVRYLARQDATTLGILGAGGMARTHAEAIAAVRPLERIRVFSPTRANRVAMAAELTERLGIEVEAAARAEDVYPGAGILSACTSAIGPVIAGRLIEAGTHVTAIGGTLDPEACARVDVALRFGEATSPVELPDWGYDAECLTFSSGGSKVGHGGTRRYADIPVERRLAFADLLADPSRGRAGPEAVTFSERGNIHGVQFAAAAGVVYERARAAGVGRDLPDDLFLQNIRN